MGMTESWPSGTRFKRLTAVRYEFGSTDYHLSRYATILRPGGPGVFRADAPTGDVRIR